VRLYADGFLEGEAFGLLLFGGISKGGNSIQRELLNLLSGMLPVPLVGFGLCLHTLLLLTRHFLDAAAQGSQIPIYHVAADLIKSSQK